ncbi:agamous-like MADS-box protein AGL62 [Rosa rugosa]|uniref:agamous-like MADS-box protein AGL62 n=1 Tax=Rosa rugosa TaxID=74645 RepID=UPI002B40961B|nr:agamous-like MADS-box protein AGL62 [Rosa rugosa]
MVARANKGRQRIKMRKLENDSKRYIVQKKLWRFKNSSEPCTLTGAEIAVIIDSPGKNIFSFGHPSVQTIIDRYENMNPYSTNTEQLTEAACRRKVEDLMAELDAINEDLQNEKMKRKILNQEERADRPDSSLQNPAIGAIKGFKNFVQPSAATALLFHGGNSSNHNTMNPYDPMPSPPPPAGPWNLNFGSQ